MHVEFEGFDSSTETFEAVFSREYTNMVGLAFLLLNSSELAEEAVQDNLDRSATYAEFEEFWADSPEILDAVDPEDLPTSFRAVAGSRDAIPELAQRLQTGDGVLKVETAPDFEAHCEQADQDPITNWLESILN